MYPKFLPIFTFLNLAPNSWAVWQNVSVSSCTSGVETYTPATYESLLALLSRKLHPINLWDGPKSVTSAKTTMSIKSWTVEELKYYNYFVASIYCTKTLTSESLECCVCAQFNRTVAYHRIIYNEFFGTKALITLHPVKEEIVVTFRGGVTMANTIMAFSPGTTTMTTTSRGKIKLHKGYLMALLSIYNEVVSELHWLLEMHPDYRVVVTGHSLGSAMASFLIYFIKSLDQFPATEFGLVTFGQPRIGNVPFADFMNGLDIKIGRVVSRGDWVPHMIVPYSAKLFTFESDYYVHHGQEVWINGKTTIFCSKTVYEDPRCSNSLGPVYLPSDHLQHFDVDYSTCYFLEAFIDISSLPLLRPSKIFSRMPKKIFNFLQPIETLIFQAVLPQTGK